MLYAASLCLVPLVPMLVSSPRPLFVPRVLFGAAQSLNLPNAFSLLTAEAPSENRGAFLSINSTLLRLGQTLGPPLMAAAALPLGLGGAYFAAATLALSMLLVALAVIR